MVLQRIELNFVDLYCLKDILMQKSIYTYVYKCRTSLIFCFALIAIKTNDNIKLVVINNNFGL